MAARTPRTGADFRHGPRPTRRGDVQGRTRSRPSDDAGRCHRLCAGGNNPVIGTLVQNRYRLDAELGRGGMGVVYRAHDTLLDRDVAVKVLSRSVLGAEGRARLLREAQAAARLNHPNIVSVYDVGEANDVPFVVMELVEGESLRHHQPKAIDEILSIV